MNQVNVQHVKLILAINMDYQCIQLQLIKSGQINKILNNIKQIINNFQKKDILKSIILALIFNIAVEILIKLHLEQDI